VAAATIVNAKTVVGWSSIALRDEVAESPPDLPDLVDFEIAAAAFACPPIAIVLPRRIYSRNANANLHVHGLSAMRLTVRRRTGEVL
jgi:hypothetical protein